MLLSGTRSSFSNVFCPPTIPNRKWVDTWETTRYRAPLATTLGSLPPPPNGGGTRNCVYRSHAGYIDVPLYSQLGNVLFTILWSHASSWHSSMADALFCSIVVFDSGRVGGQASSVKRRDRVTIPKTHVVTSVNKGVLCIFPNRVRPAWNWELNPGPTGEQQTQQESWYTYFKFLPLCLN